MTQLPHEATDLKKIYETRFAGRAELRESVWRGWRVSLGAGFLAMPRC